jgi:hypothetical protein
MRNKKVKLHTRCEILLRISLFLPVQILPKPPDTSDHSRLQIPNNNDSATSSHIHYYVQTSCDEAESGDRATPAAKPANSLQLGLGLGQELQRKRLRRWRVKIMPRYVVSLRTLLPSHSPPLFNHGVRLGGWLPKCAHLFSMIASSLQLGLMRRLKQKCSSRWAEQDAKNGSSIEQKG